MGVALVSGGGLNVTITNISGSFFFGFHQCRHSPPFSPDMWRQGGGKMVPVAPHPAKVFGGGEVARRCSCTCSRSGASRRTSSSSWARRAASRAGWGPGGGPTYLTRHAPSNSFFLIPNSQFPTSTVFHCHLLFFFSESLPRWMTVLLCVLWWSSVDWRICDDGAACTFFSTFY